MKFARCSKPAEAVKCYLPNNFHVCEAKDGGSLIYGSNDHGWTLADYVIPRLGSGMICAEEIQIEEFWTRCTSGSAVELRAYISKDKVRKGLHELSCYLESCEKPLDQCFTEYTSEGSKEPTELQIVELLALAKELESKIYSYLGDDNESY